MRRTINLFSLFNQYSAHQQADRHGRIEAAAAVKK
jgi:hypothetical protein